MKIKVTEPFNYGHRPNITHYPKGEHDVPQAVADHAAAHGFSAKAPTKPEAPADKA